MAKIVTIDGEKFISTEEIVQAMLEQIMMNVYGPMNLVVDEDEANLVRAYEDLLVRIGDIDVVNRLRGRYVCERFVARRKLE